MKQPLILPVLCHKSATTYQIDSYKVSNSKLKRDVCNCVKTESIESTAPPQQAHKQGTAFLGHPVLIITHSRLVFVIDYIEAKAFTSLFRSGITIEMNHKSFKAFGKKKFRKIYLLKNKCYMSKFKNRVHFREEKNYNIFEGV